MKVINNPSMPGACSERQVLLYPTDWEDPFPETMEDIRVSIVNDRASGSKREREVTAVTPSAKRSCQAVFSCSTPVSSCKFDIQSKTGKEHPDSPSWHLLKKDEELDDSLLEPSDDEDDSELYLTVDEIETLLGEDDNDSCYAAEPSQKYNETTSYVVTFTPLELENNGENGGASPGQTRDSSDTLVEESECEGDIGNYAAMPPSPSHSAIDPIEVTKPNQSSVCNVKSHQDPIPLATTVIASDLPTPLSEVKEVYASQLPNSLSLKLPLQPNLSFYGLGVADDWTEDPDIVFDSDIDNLLAISPGAASSLEDNVVELATVVTKASSIATAEPKLSTKSSEQNVASKKPSEAKGTQGKKNVASTSSPTDPTTSANSSQSKIAGSSGPEKAKPLIAVAAIPPPSFRESISELNAEKDHYCYQVQMHIDQQGENNLEDPLSELASLLNQISQENENWQHPSNLTKRNHPRVGKKQFCHLTLNQWVKKNGGTNERFKNIPDLFQRSPVPDALPYSTS